MTPRIDFGEELVLVAVLCGLWAWVSLSLITRMWVMHRRVPASRKLLWSLFLSVPLFGWLAYAAFFHTPDYNDTECPTDNFWGPD